jgi:hypothetical protein
MASVLCAWAELDSALSAVKAANIAKLLGFIGLVVRFTDSPPTFFITKLFRAGLKIVFRWLLSAFTEICQRAALALQDLYRNFWASYLLRYSADFLSKCSTSGDALFELQQCCCTGPSSSP